MKVFRVAAIMLMCSWVMPFQAWAGGEIILAGDVWCPYNCEQNASLPGYAVEIAQRIFGEAGYAVSYRVVPWSRAVVECRTGRYAAVIGATPGEVDGFVFPEEPVGRVANDFFVRAGDTWRFTGMDSLLFRRLGVVRGYDYDPVFNNFLATAPKGKVFYSSGDNPAALNLKMLLGGRIDVVMDDRVVVRWLARKEGVRDKIEFAGSDDVFVDVYIAFSPMHDQSIEFSEMFSSGIRKLRASGELRKILDKYGLRDWK